MLNERNVDTALSVVLQCPTHGLGGEEGGRGRGGVALGCRCCRTRLDQRACCVQGMSAMVSEKVCSCVFLPLPVAAHFRTARAALSSAEGRVRDGDWLSCLASRPDWGVRLSVLLSVTSILNCLLTTYKLSVHSHS